MIEVARDSRATSILFFYIKIGVVSLMEFSIEFYETVAGGCPVRDFLNEMSARDPNDFAAIMAGIGRLRNRLYHRPPLTKPIGNGLFELRHVGKLNTRVLYIFIRGRRIILLHGIRNKGQEITIRDRKIALDRMNEWCKRKLNEKD